MRFSLVSLLAVPALVAADPLSDLANGFSTLSCGDTAGISSWLASYTSAVDSHYKSVYQNAQATVCSNATGAVATGATELPPETFSLV
ncbi:hypothetical protein JCM33374_g3576 [Metschnikowia sp. JCM 33374]|nr:hypothetical protein JCM33374_g3576 [Metschnikowia sp. JCM 33374]